jgi:peptidyl-prolyl cis-trans isomerase A (cyclophilin A)
MTAGLLAGEEIRIKLAKGIAAEELVRGVHRAAGQAILYAPKELAGKTLPGSLDVAIPRASTPDFLVFALSTCGLRARRYASDSPTSVPALEVVLPESSLATDFRLTGFDLPLVFDRGPASWRSEADLAGSLAAGTVRDLVGRLAAGDARAAQLLGYLGPRSPATVGALTAALQDEGCVASAAWALARCGYAGKPAIPALRKAIQRWGTKHADALQGAIRALERSLHPALLDPARARETAPERYVVRLETTRGDIDIEVTRAWSPAGADRFYNLVRIGFFDGVAFYRVIRGFVAQFGKHGDPRVNRAWFNATIRDERPKQANDYGYVTFARGDDPHSRGTEVFINLKDNANLNDPDAGFAPFGRVIGGMKAAEKLHSGYGDLPRAGRIHFDGDAYLRRNFPKLDYIRRTVILEMGGK